MVLVLKWSFYSRCEEPINVFLLVDYAIIFVFRALHFLANVVRPTHPTLARNIEHFRVGVVYVLFIGWTLTGTVWFSSSYQCLEGTRQFYIFVVWILLCYLWIALYVCYLCLQRTLGLDEDLADPDMNPFDLNLLELTSPRGLTRQQIDGIVAYKCPAALPDLFHHCSVCMEKFAAQDDIKRLPRCGHLFHAHCINQWLELKNACPVCRAQVVEPPPGEAARPSVLANPDIL